MGTADLNQIDGRLYRETLAQVPRAVTVVTALGSNGEFRGITVDTLTTVSFDPPLVMVCVDSLTIACEVLRDSECFGASVLSTTGEFLAERFAGRAPLMDGQFREASHFVAASGCPLLDASVCWFDCRIETRLPLGDHHIFSGRVLACGTRSGVPLLYHRRGYRTL